MNRIQLVIDDMNAANRVAATFAAFGAEKHKSETAMRIRKNGKVEIGFTKENKFSGEVVPGVVAKNASALVTDRVAEIKPARFVGIGKTMVSRNTEFQNAMKKGEKIERTAFDIDMNTGKTGYQALDASGKPVRTANIQMAAFKAPAKKPASTVKSKDGVEHDLS